MEGTRTARPGRRPAWFQSSCNPPATGDAVDVPSGALKHMAVSVGATQRCTNIYASRAGRLARAPTLPAAGTCADGENGAEATPTFPPLPASKGVLSDFLAPVR